MRHFHRIWEAYCFMDIQLAHRRLHSDMPASLSARITSVNPWRGWDIAIRTNDGSICRNDGSKHREVGPNMWSRVTTQNDLWYVLPVYAWRSQQAHSRDSKKPNMSYRLLYRVAS